MIFRADPNKSIYLFAPSSFPIEHNKAYCRNFCLFFPSYNRGFTDNFGLQFGAFVFPGLENILLVSTIKYSLPNLLTMRDDSHDDVKEKEFAKIDKIIENTFKLISFATGIIYASIPVIAFEDRFSCGSAFGTLTIGNKFNHLSTSICFGLVNNEFSKKPIYNLAGNYRLSNAIAIVGEL